MDNSSDNKSFKQIAAIISDTGCEICYEIAQYSLEGKKGGKTETFLYDPRCDSADLTIIPLGTRNMHSGLHALA